MKASDYKKLATKAQTTEKFKLPSGAIFELRVPNKEQWVMAGKLPASLVAKMTEIVKQSKGNDQKAAENAIANLTIEEFTQTLELGRALLIYSAVSPKVSVDGDGDTLAITDILPDDYAELMKWVWSGGKQGESLETFRQG